MVYRILHIGEEPLRHVSEPVSVIDEDLRRLVDDMFETMYQANGCGLAAPQIGKNIRLAIVDVGDNPVVMINPEVSCTSGKQDSDEGCLSLPGLRERVTRANRVVVEFTELDGERYEIEAEGLMARAILHEIDHLDGILFVDRISRARRKQIKHEIERLEAGEDLSEDEDSDVDVHEEANGRDNVVESAAVAAQ